MARVSDLTRMDDEQETCVIITVPVVLARRWEELRRKARTLGGAPDETAEVEMIIKWAHETAARRSREP